MATEFFSIPSSEVAETLVGFPVFFDLSRLPTSFWSLLPSDGAGLHVLSGLDGDVLASDGLVNDSNGWGNFTGRVVIPASALDLPGRQIRLTLQSDPGNDLSINQLYIGRAAADGATTQPDFIQTPSQLTFSGGSTTATLTADSTIQTDWVDIDIDDTHDLIMSFYISAGSNQNFSARTTATGFETLFIAGDDAVTVVASGYSTGTRDRVAIKQIETRQARSPVDLVDIDTVAETGSIYFRTVLSDSNNNPIEIVYDALVPLPATTDPYGRNAVWDDYEWVAVPAASLTDRTGNNADGTTTGTPVFADAGTGTDAQLAGGGAVTLDGTEHYDVTVSDISTLDGILTMGTSFNHADTTEDTPVSYRDQSSGATDDRISMTIDNGNSVAVWDDANLFLYTSPTTDPGTGTWYRQHVSYDAAVERNIHVNAASKNTDATITDMSARGMDLISIGREDTSNAERFNGEIGWTYLRGGVLSDNWKLAEYNMLNDNAQFMAVSAALAISPMQAGQRNVIIA